MNIHINISCLSVPPPTKQRQELWKTRKPPSPLRLATLLPDADGAASDAALSAAAAAAFANGGAGSGGVARALGLGEHSVWSDADAARVFLAAVVAFLEHRAGDLGHAVFDKVRGRQRVLGGLHCLPSCHGTAAATAHMHAQRLNKKQTTHRTNHAAANANKQHNVGRRARRRLCHRRLQPARLVLRHPQAVRL